ncbi:MAG: TonB-dependent receptor domain-containing protein [Candidatus Cyclobacteriaceae bacterium M3_2C_046]
MIRIGLSFLILSIYAVSAGAQSADQVTITGNVMDGETTQPIEFATVSLYHPRDSSLITGVITDPTGKFDLNVVPGQYLLKVQFLSYQNLEQLIQTGVGPTKNLGVLTIYEDAAQLDEVVVQGERTQMEMKLDKRIFNIGQDLVSRGGNLSVILDNLPSVAVDVDGNVSLRGSQNVRILINGKPSGLVGLNGADALRNMNGNLVERVEIITNPSARYEAEGMAGIINIVLKKDRSQGLNGAFTFEAGYPANHGTSFNLNFRKEWINFFANVGVNYRNSPREGSAHQQFFLPDSSYSTDLVREMSRKEFSNNLRFGTDIFINEKNTLTGSLLYSISRGDNPSSVIYYDRNINQELVATTERIGLEAEDETLLEYDINYTRKFEQEDEEFTIDIQYRSNSEIEDADLSEDGSHFVNPLLQHSLNDEASTNFMFRANYVKPFGKNKKFETGLMSTLRTINTQYLVEEQNEQQVWERLEQFSNNFDYEEDIHAAYAIYGDEFEKFSYQVGLRTEYTYIKTHLVDTDEKNTLEFLNLFPSLHLNYKLAKENSVQISYSRRFDRPGFRSLNPFFSFNDNRNIRSGNPKLQPEFTDSYETGYLYNWGQGSLYAGLYYRYTTGKIERISTVEDGITYIMPQNLSTENSYGIETNLTKDFFDWFKIDGNFNFFKSVVEGNFNGEDLSASTVTMSGRLNNQFKLFKKVDFQLSSYYRAPVNTPQGRRQSYYTVDLGFSKEILKEKGTIIFNIRNILNSMRWRSETFGENFYYESEYIWRPRQFSITLDYRLNQNQKKGRRSGGRGEGGMDGGGDF